MADKSLPASPRIAELTRRLEKEPGSRAFLELAREYQAAGRLDETVRVCREGLKKHPSYHSARVLLARALLERKEFAEARRELETVVRQAPDNLLARRLLAESLDGAGEPAAALSVLGDLLRLSPEDKEARDLVAGIEARAAAPAPPGTPPPSAEETAQVPAAEEFVEPAPAPAPPSRLEAGVETLPALRPAPLPASAFEDEAMRSTAELEAPDFARPAVDPGPAAPEVAPPRAVPAAPEPPPPPAPFVAGGGFAAQGSGIEPVVQDLTPGRGMFTGGGPPQRAELHLAARAPGESGGEPALSERSFHPSWIEEPVPVAPPEIATATDLEPRDLPPATVAIEPPAASPAWMDVPPVPPEPERDEAPQEPDREEASQEPGGIEALPTPTLAEIYAAQGMPEKAVEIYRKVLEGDPRNDEARARLRQLSGEAPAGVAPEKRIRALEAWLETIRRAH